MTNRCGVRGGVLNATYVYNARGQRVKKVEATGAKRTFVFHYGLGGELLGETVRDDLPDAPWAR